MMIPTDTEILDYLATNWYPDGPIQYIMGLPYHRTESGTFRDAVIARMRKEPFKKQ